VPCNTYITPMTTSAIRRQTALAAIARVVAGARVAEVEDAMVDFKEEAGTVLRGGARTPIDPQHAPAAERLAVEVACLANSRAGGILVVGVDDKGSGPNALVGTYLDLDWLRRRIWSLTSPHYSLDEIEEITSFGARLYLINVPPALEEIRAGGRLRMRRGTDCVEVSGDDARRLLEERRGFDWTAEPSGVRLSAADPVALRSARRRYQERRGAAPDSDRDLVSRMGVVLDDTDDPELNRAGALLLAPFEPSVDQLQLLITDAEGLPSRQRLLRAAPILPALDEAFALLDTVAFPEGQPVIVAGTRRELRSVPEAAYREALVNAIMHRDYQLDRLTVVAIATGSPSEAIKVRSPGGLPANVSIGRLLGTPSRPRNEALARALRALGVAEREGVGITTMYRTMLRDGHPPPEIVEDAGDVVVRLAGGRPDVGLRAFFDDLESRDGRLGRDVAAVIAIRELLLSTPLRPEELAFAAQRTVGEALETLRALEQAGAIERLLDRSRSFRLARDARRQLGSRIDYRRSTLDEHWALVRALLDESHEISRDDAVKLLDVTPDRASRILGQLLRGGRLTLAGPRRGRSVRYRHGPG
jgi:ATP-dependent DNA helicase RecG